MESIKTILLEAPESEIDPSILGLIEKWDEPATPLQILEALDMSVHYAAASDFAIGVFQVILDQALARENMSYDEVVAKAVWRK